MPTARPSIVASVGAVEFSVVNPLTAEMPSIPTPTPTIAVNSGRTAARTVPNATRRITNAATSPISSVVWLVLEAVDVTPPENSTSSPAFRAGSATRFSAAFVESFSWSTDTRKCRSANAIRWSRESCRVDLNARALLTDCGTCSASPTVGSTTVR
jgi:hypothetical protein